MASHVVHLEDTQSGATADVLISRFSWRTPSGGRTHEQLWAEASFGEGDKRASGSGIPLLFPFPSRIRGGLFEYGGVRRQLEPNDGQGNALHGFVLNNPWRVVEQTDDRVVGEFCPSIDAPQLLDQWTGDYTLTASYRVAGDQLLFEATAKNTGSAPLPFGFGTHAYFRLPITEGADAEQTIVRAPVDAEWVSENLIPTGETRAIMPEDALPAGAPLAGRTLDCSYRFKPGATTTELLDPSSGCGVRQTFDDSMRCCVIYTPPHREAICLEPYTCTPNLFELEAGGVASGLRELAPGESYQTKITLEAFRDE